jgi:hypothetical protein
METGENVYLRGFGSFVVKKRAAISVVQIIGQNLEVMFTDLQETSVSEQPLLILNYKLMEIFTLKVQAMLGQLVWEKVCILDFIMVMVMVICNLWIEPTIPTMVYNLTHWTTILELMV